MGRTALLHPEEDDFEGTDFQMRRETGSVVPRQAMSIVMAVEANVGSRN